MFISSYDSKFGKIFLVSNGTNLVGLYFEHQKYFPSEILKYEENSSLEIFKNTKLWLDEYFAGKVPNINLQLTFVGTTFQKQVWKILQAIPYGQIVSYGEIASIIAKKQNKNRMSAQAVGSAVSKNPISIIVPCHRVVGKTGELTGYAGGIDKKVGLLTIEGHKIDLENLKIEKTH